MLFKMHHSWADGVSAISYMFAMADGYDPTALISIKRLSCSQKFLLRICAPFYLPFILMKILKGKAKTNPLHDGKR
jgi:hypothetical protein